MLFVLGMKVIHCHVSQGMLATVIGLYVDKNVGGTPFPSPRDLKVAAHLRAFSHELQFQGGQW